MSSIYFKKGFTPLETEGRCEPSRFLTGFTLVEMMVVISIVIIMLGVVLANLPAFRDRTSLDLVAQEMALVIRQAQSYGTNIRGFLSGSTAEFPSYGIRFNLGDGSGGDPSSDKMFTLFADRAGGTPGKYDYAGGCGNTGSECREVYNLQGGLTINALYVCGSSGCGSSIPALNIVFNRPNPEANFNGTNGTSICSGCSYAKITLHQQRLNTDRNICIWTTGHIYAAPTC